jgi:molecular chaperone DnaK (HSP70)
VEVGGATLNLPRTGDGQTPLALRNLGAGPVEYTLRVAEGQPWLYLLGPNGKRMLVSEERRLGPSQVDNSLRLGAVVEETPAEASVALLEVHSSDRGPDRPGQARPWKAEAHRWRTQRVSVPLRRLGGALILVSAGLVVFTARRRKVRLLVQNVGGAEAELEVLGLPSGVEVVWEEAAAQTSDALVLDVSLSDSAPSAGVPNQRCQLKSGAAAYLWLLADESFAGTAEAAIASVEGNRYPLVIHAEENHIAPSLVSRWTLGIDFGTAKSAVYYTDNWVPVTQRRPQPILWPTTPRATDRTAPVTRSALLYRGESKVPLCGHQVPVAAGAEAENELVVESIKTLLRQDSGGITVDLPSGAQVTPVEMVARFLSYVLEEVRRNEAFRQGTGLDARVVLTLPVMEDRDTFLRQRESTLQAAEAAGLAVEEVLTPSEPECAALDLMHCLRRGYYTFDGKPYQLQEGEVILVLDCGAGTTDVAALRVSLNGGTFHAEQLAAAGYRFGGDTVDDLLLSWLLEGQAEHVGFQWRGPRAFLKLPELADPMPLAAAREECRRVKESLFIAGVGDAPRPFSTDLGSFQIGTAHVERLMVPFVEAILSQSLLPDPRELFPALDRRLDDRLREALWREMSRREGHRTRPLEQVLREANLKRSDVGFLFITGGTGQIPVLRSRLGAFFGPGTRGVVAGPEDCTVNVARGAALYYDYRISGILRCGIDLVGRQVDSTEEFFREHALTPGALPGPEVQRAVLLGAHQSIELSLEAAYPGQGPRGAVARHLLRNSSPEARQLVVTLRYGSDHVLVWQAAFADGEAAVPWEEVLQA